MSEIYALCFGPGLLEGGEELPVALQEEGFLIRPGEPGEQRVPYEQVQVTLGGFDHDRLILSFRRGDEAWSLALVDPASRQRFLLDPPPQLADQLARLKNKMRSHRRAMRLGQAVIALLLFVPFFVVFLFLTRSDQIIDWIVDQVSMESEVHLGNLIFEQTRHTLKLLPSGEQVKAIEEIGWRLSKGLPYRFSWYVAEDAAVNAFAIPGGHVVVFTGLIDAADSAEEVAGVLAHEIQHVVQRHSLKAMVRQMGWRAAVSLVVGGLGGDMIGDLATQLGALKFGRDQETEADRHGLGLLKQAKIDPREMISFFEKLANHEQGGFALLSTHPASRERIAALESEIKEIGPWKATPLPYDWSRIKNGSS